MPSVGINIPVGSGSTDHSIGRRLALLVGWNARPTMSLNAELSLDDLDGNGYYFSTKPDEKYLGVAFNPLFSVHLRRAAVVFGLSAGYFRYTLWVHELYAGGSTVASKQTAQGYSGGVNIGVFVPVGGFAIGGMFNARLHHSLRSCTSSTLWTSELCSDGSKETGVLGLSGALLF